MMGLNLGLNLTAASAIVLSTSTASPGDVIDILGLTAQEAKDASFQWREADGPAISGATGPRYTVTAADIGRVIEAQVTIGGDVRVTEGTVTVVDPTAPPPNDQPTQITLNDFSRDRTLFDVGLAVGRDSANIPLSGTADAGAAIEARIVTESGTEIAPWAQIATTNSAGNWVGVVSTSQNAEWMRPEVRLAANTVVDATTVNRFGTGLIFVLSEQSNGYRIVKDYDGLNADPTITPGDIEDPEAFQIIDLFNRGDKDDPDTGTVGTYRFVTNEEPRTKPLAEMASILTRNKPGLKVLLVSDNKPGLSQDITLRDGDNRRRFEAVQALFDSVTADGATIGAFLLSHTNALNGSEEEYANYVAAAFLNKNLDGSDFASSFPAALPDGNGNIHHTWLELLPGLETGDTVLIAQGTGFGGVYPSTDNFVTGHGTYFHKQSRELLAATFPDQIILGGQHGLAELGKTDGGTWADNSHYTAISDIGIMERARSLMAMTLRDVGALDFALPQIDQITWTTDYVRLGSSAGPITTMAKVNSNLPALDPAAHPLFQGDVLGLASAYDDQIVRAEIVAPGTMTPANAGEIIVYPNDGGSFDGLSRLYFEPFGGGPALDSYTYYVNRGARHRAIVNAGVVGWDGVKVQLPADPEIINAANDLPQPGGLHILPANYVKYENAWFSNASQWTFEVRLQAPPKVGLFFVKNDSHYIRLANDGSVTVMTKVARGNNTTVFDRTFDNAVDDVTELNTIRVVVDYPGQTVRLFVNDVEKEDTHFGQAGQMNSLADDINRPENVVLLAQQAGAGLAHVRLWKTANADGSAPPAEDAFAFVEVQPDGGAAASANLDLVLE